MIINSLLLLLLLLHRAESCCCSSVFLWFVALCTVLYIEISCVSSSFALLAASIVWSAFSYDSEVGVVTTVAAAAAFDFVLVDMSTHLCKAPLLANSGK
jgi:hypothetical protein